MSSCAVAMSATSSASVERAPRSALAGSSTSARCAVARRLSTRRRSASPVAGPSSRRCRAGQQHAAGLDAAARRRRRCPAERLRQAAEGPSASGSTPSSSSVRRSRPAASTSTTVRSTTGAIGGADGSRRSARRVLGHARAAAASTCVAAPDELARWRARRRAGRWRGQVDADDHRHAQRDAEHRERELRGMAREVAQARAREHAMAAAPARARAAAPSWTSSTRSARRQPLGAVRHDHQRLAGWAAAGPRPARARPRRCPRPGCRWVRRPAPARGRASGRAPGRRAAARRPRGGRGSSPRARSGPPRASSSRARAPRGPVEPALELDRQQQVLLDRERRDQVEELEHEAEVLAPQQRALPPRTAPRPRGPARAREPASARSMPLIRLSRVDLPEPLRPSTTTNSPRATVRSTPSNTTRRLAPSP